MILGVLDQSPIRKGASPREAVLETIELARAAERWGYGRYWLAEHHSSGGLASATPEVLIAAVAARTSRIRVGSGGVMLTHYSPLKVAETFRMLEALHPGRIDLGVGRAPGSDTRTARALAAGLGQLDIDHYTDQLLDLYGYLADNLPPGHPFRGIKAMPAGETLPELWLLGSSTASAHYAAELGWSFCFAHFINPDSAEAAIDLYRRLFNPSPFLAAPRVSMGLSVTVADTEAEAERLSWSRWAWRLMAQKGFRDGIPSPEEAMAFDFTVPERDYIDHVRSRSLFGTPGQVKDRLDACVRAFGLDELMLVTITYDFAARLRSYELLARAYGLVPGVAAK